MLKFSYFYSGFIAATTLLLMACGGSDNSKKNEIAAASSSSLSSESPSSVGSSSSSSSFSSESLSSVGSSSSIFFEPLSSAGSSIPSRNYKDAVTVNSLQVDDYGLTVHVNGRLFVPAEMRAENYQIDFGDGFVIAYPEAWHTYPEAGSYEIKLKITQGNTDIIHKQSVTVNPLVGNHAPIVRLASRGAKIFASNSYDKDGNELSYVWDFGFGPFEGESLVSETYCEKGALVTVTASDGYLADTRQVAMTSCEHNAADDLPDVEFTYESDGLTLFVDGSPSVDDTGMTWDFGDGSEPQKGLMAVHTYAAPGNYQVRLNVAGAHMFSRSLTKEVSLPGTAETPAE